MTSDGRIESKPDYEIDDGMRKRVLLIENKLTNSFNS